MPNLKNIEVMVKYKCYDSVISYFFPVQAWANNFTSICNCPNKVGCHFFRFLLHLFLHLFLHLLLPLLFMHFSNIPYIDSILRVLH